QISRIVLDFLRPQASAWGTLCNDLRDPAFLQGSATGLLGGPVTRHAPSLGQSSDKGTMARILTVCLLATSLLGCSLFRGRAPQDFFVLFFVPGTTQLSPEAQQIVRQAADDARTERAKIVIAIPPDTPGGVRLV